MSKTAQRKSGAYTRGYQIGRHATWGEQWILTFPGDVGAAFEQGREDGRHDRALFRQWRMEQRSPLVRFLRWLTKGRA
jgi:hypothetical protein